MLKKYYTSITEEDTIQFVCSICNKTFSKQTNVCRHISTVHEDIIQKNVQKKQPQKNYDLQFYYEGSTISKELVQLIIWKNMHAISVRAITDSIFTKLCSFYIPHDKKFTLIQNSIATQILQQKFEKCRDKLLSITIDAGTVIESKWLAIGGLLLIGAETKYMMFDVFTVDDSLTADNLCNIVQDLKEKLANYDSEIIGVCTDNAANFVKVFGIDYSGVLNILRISCCAHTIQLAVKDFIEKIDEIDSIISILKFLSAKINSMTKTQKEKHHFPAFPNIQSQRWNWIFLGLEYVLTNWEPVQIFLDANNMAYSYFDILQLKLILEPASQFTTVVEGDNITLADAYEAFKNMTKNLKRLQQDNSKAIILKRTIKKRFKKTGSLDIIKIVYYSTYKGISYFQKKFIAPIKSAGSIHEKTLLQEKKQRQFEHLQATIYEIMKYWPDESTKEGSISTAFLFTEMLSGFTVPNNELQTQKFPKFTELEQFFTDGAFRLFTFIEKLNTLPATEAQSERIFAGMRDVMNENMTRLSPQVLRDMIIITYYGRELFS